jgi:PST family polysaccharide transporter
MTGDVWALAGGAAAHTAVRTTLLLRAAPHPCRPSLSRREVRDLLSFGIGETLNRIGAYVGVTADAFVVGRWLGAPALGFYSRAYQVTALPLAHVSAVMNSVLFPAFSRIQGELARVRRGYLASVALASLAAFPLLAAVAAIAPELLVAVLGAKWAAAIVPLQILCVGGMLQAVSSLGDAVARSAGAIYWKSACQGVYAACVIAGAVVGLPWGVNGVAVGVVAAMAIMYVLMSALSLRVAQARWREFFAAQRPAACIAAVVFGVGYVAAAVLRGVNPAPWPVLVGAALACVAAGGLAIVLVPRRWYDATVLEALDALRRKLRVQQASTVATIAVRWRERRA